MGILHNTSKKEEKEKMSLDKAIEHGKEHRKPHRKAKAVDKTCRNHGWCPWCKESRLYKNKKRQQKADYKEE